MAAGAAAGRARPRSRAARPSWPSSGRRPAHATAPARTASARPRARHHNHCRPACGARAISRTVEQTTDAADERSIGRGEREPRARVHCRQGRQRVHVDDAIADATPRDRRSSARAPRARGRTSTTRRVIEQQRLDDRLQQIDEVVVPPDVRELVRESASSCAAVRPDKAEAGTSTTGFSQPTTIGTATADDSARRTNCRTPSRSATRAASRSMSAVHAGARFRDASRRATIQPPVRRTDSTSTPTARRAPRTAGGASAL